MFNSRSKPKKTMNQQMNYYAHCARITGGGMGMAHRLSFFCPGKSVHNHPKNSTGVAILNPPIRKGGTKRKFHRQGK